MNSQSKELEKLYNAFPLAYINRLNEIIIFRPTNTSFTLDNVSDQLELDCKVLEYCSRSAYKKTNKKTKVLEYCSRLVYKNIKTENEIRYHKTGITIYFDRKFDIKELELIYTRLGNQVNRELCIEFIKSNLDMKLLLKEKGKQHD